MKKITMAFLLVLGLTFGASVAFAVSLDEFKAAFSPEMTVDQVSAKLAELNGEDMSMLFMGLKGNATMAEVYKKLDNDAEIKDQFSQILEMVSKVK